MKKINALRREQGLLQTDWAQVFIHADPCLHGALGIAREAGWPAPELEIWLPGGDEAVEVAWLHNRVAIDIAGKVVASRWKVLSLAAAATYGF